MNVNEILILVLTVYILIGACAGCALSVTGSVRMVLFGVTCWPFIAWQGLKLILRRARSGAKG